MKTNMKSLRKAIRETVEEFNKEGVSQSKRVRHGYPNDEPNDYDTGSEGLGEAEECPFFKDEDEKEEKEGVSQSKRAGRGYGDEPADYDVPELDGMKKEMEMPKLKILAKEATPTDKEEEFVLKNKEAFKKRYGAKYKEILYATARKMFGQKK